MDTSVHNYRKIKQLDFRRQDSFVVSSGILKQILETARWDLGEKFRLWMEGKDTVAGEICALVEKYFEDLKKEMLYAKE